LISFDEVVDLELAPSTDVPAAAQPQRKAEGRWRRHPPRDLFGLALSGGGIRSATFNLGVLQGLAELNLLICFDYLSTVSGGGYIGAFWSAWRARSATKDPFPASSKGELHPCSGPECPEIRHLREFSNFLVPKLGLFTLDTGNAVVTVVASLIPSLLAALSLILLVLYTWAGTAWHLFNQPARNRSTAVFVGALLLIQSVFELWWHRSSKAEGRSMAAYVFFSVLGLAAAGVLWQRLFPFWFFSPSVLRRLLAPAGAAGGAALLLIIVRWLLSRWMESFSSRSLRGALDRALSRFLFAVAAWLVLGGLCAAGLWLSDHSVMALLAAGTSGGAFAWVRKILISEPSKPRVGGFVEQLKPLIPQILAYITVALMAILCFTLLLQYVGHEPTIWLRLAPLWAAVGIILLTLLFFNPNEVGIHAFYRSRLARTYLGASNAVSQKTNCNRVTADWKEDDLPLNELSGGKPFHLICCAANDLAGDQLENLFRGAKAPLSRASASLSATSGPPGEACAPCRPWGMRSPRRAPLSTRTWAGIRWSGGRP
jgi:hypothetical protein